jgi:hypothetical protein
VGGTDVGVAVGVGVSVGGTDVGADVGLGLRVSGTAVGVVAGVAFAQAASTRLMITSTENMDQIVLLFILTSVKYYGVEIIVFINS